MNMPAANCVAHSQKELSPGSWVPLTSFKSVLYKKKKNSCVLVALFGSDKRSKQQADKVCA